MCSVYNCHVICHVLSCIASYQAADLGEDEGDHDSSWSGMRGECVFNLHRQQTNCLFYHTKIIGNNLSFSFSFLTSFLFPMLLRVQGEF